VIDFGQLGDVILSLPALHAIAEKFPDAKRSIVVGSPCAEIVRMTELFDEVIPVDRVELLVSNKIWSSIQILKFARDIRRRRFDLVIDLHSLPETNLLGYVSGAKHRLFANRESRSIDFLSNYEPKPPKEDKSIHLSEVYLAAIEPFGIRSSIEGKFIRPKPVDVDFVRALLSERVVRNEQLIGINIGAGHPSRQWKLEKYCALAHKLADLSNHRTIVFLGPEERSAMEEIAATFPQDSIILDKLNIPQLAAAFSMLSVLTGNDTGPMHLAAAIGTPIVLLLNDEAQSRFLPRAEKSRFLRQSPIGDLPVDAVFNVVRELL